MLFQVGNVGADGFSFEGLKRATVGGDVNDDYGAARPLFPLRN